MTQLSILAAQERFEELRQVKGEEWWERWHALPPSERPEDCRAVACPNCGARAGSYCRKPSGHSGGLTGAHAARWDRVLAEAEARNPKEER